MSLIGAEYLTAVAFFIQGCEMNLADPAAVTLALNINSVAVTLTAQQVQFILLFYYWSLAITIVFTF